MELAEKTYSRLIHTILCADVTTDLLQVMYQEQKKDYFLPDCPTDRQLKLLEDAEQNQQHNLFSYSFLINSEIGLKTIAWHFNRVWEQRSNKVSSYIQHAAIKMASFTNVLTAIYSQLLPSLKESVLILVFPAPRAPQNQVKWELHCS